jgi:hypothetical protein
MTCARCQQRRAALALSLRIAAAHARKRTADTHAALMMTMRGRAIKKGTVGAATTRGARATAHHLDIANAAFRLLFRS